MYHKLSIALLLLSLACVASQRNRKNGACSYYTDPHLIPFPTAPGESQNLYFCQPDGPEVLVKNDFLEIKVTSTPNGNYPIIEYSLIIHPVAGHPSPCIITDTAANPLNSISCPATSPAIATLSGSYLHIKHLTEAIIIEINNYGSHINVHVHQSFDIIARSTGICVNYDCELLRHDINDRKKRDIIADSDVTAICDAFVAAAAKLAENDVDPSVVVLRRTACIHDISMTGKTEYARGIGNAILRSSIQRNEDDSYDAEQLLKANAVGEQSFCQAIEIVNQIIAQSSNRCNGDQTGKPCLQSLNAPKLCNAG